MGAGARRRQHDARDSLGMMPWYPRDWRASTARAQLTVVGRLAYRELLDAGWLQGGSLPSDDRSLAGLAGISLKDWARVRVEVLAYFDKGEDGRLRNRRQAWEHERAVALRDARRKGAAKTNKPPDQGGGSGSGGAPLSGTLSGTPSAGIPSTDTVNRQPTPSTDTDTGRTEGGKRRAEGSAGEGGPTSHGDGAPPPPAASAPAGLLDHEPASQDEARLAQRVYSLAARTSADGTPTEAEQLEVLRAVSTLPNSDGGKFLRDIRDAPAAWLRQSLRDCDAFEQEAVDVPEVLQPGWADPRFPALEGETRGDYRRRARLVGGLIERMPSDDGEEV